MAPKFSVVVEPDSVEMSAEKRPGAPLVLVMVELRCTVILLRLDLRDHVGDAGVFRVGIGHGSGMRLYSSWPLPPSAPLFSTRVTG